jgi:cyclophilin family peptidyl-prolyl cis-trans isomerase
MPLSFVSEPEISINRDADYTALISTTLGDLKFTLHPSSALKAVNNFIFLSGEGFYDGTTIHRLVPGFVAQGGSPDGSWNGHPGYLIDGELPPRSEPAYPPGTLALAEHRMPDDPPDTHRQGCQFFITLGTLDGFLESNSPVIGHLVEPIDVISRFNSLNTDDAEAPVETIAVNRVSISA